MPTSSSDANIETDGKSQVCRCKLSEISQGGARLRRAAVPPCGTDPIGLQVLPLIRGRTQLKFRPQVPNQVGNLEPKALPLPDC